MRFVLASVLVALLVRLYTGGALAVVSKDALWFVTGARAIAAGDFVQGWLGQDQHPLGALFVWLGGCLTGDWLAGGRLVNVIFGALAVLPVYGIARLTFGHRVGLIAAWLLAFQVHAARYSGDVLSEPSHLFFFLSASFFGLLGLRTSQTRWLAFCGASSGLAYLVRPEGLIVVLVAAAWVGLRNLRSLKQDWRARMARVLVMALAAGVFAWPYMIHIGRLTKKKSAIEIIEAKPTGARQGSTSVPGHSKTELLLKGGLKLPDEAQRSFHIKQTALYDLASKLVSAVTHALAPLVLIGLVWGAGSKPRGRGEWFLASLVLLYLFMLYGLRASAGYVSRRHAMPVALLCLPWAGAGAVVVAQWLTHIPKLDGRPQAALAGVMAIMTILPAVRLAEPRSTDKIGVAQAGIWIRKHSARPPKVVTLDKPRVALYAYSRNYDINRAFGDRVVDPARVNYRGVLAYALKIGATHVAFDRNFIEELVPGFTADLEAAEANHDRPRLAVRFRSKVKQRDAMPNLFVCEVVRKESDGGR